MRILTGPVLQWNVPIDRGSHYLRVANGAFKNLKDGTIEARFRHRRFPVLGSTKRGTLLLDSNAGALMAVIICHPCNAEANDLYDQIHAGIWYGMSGSWLSANRHVGELDGKPLKENTDAELLEVSLTQTPAFGATTVTAFEGDHFDLMNMGFFGEQAQWTN